MPRVLWAVLPLLALAACAEVPSAAVAPTLIGFEAVAGWRADAIDLALIQFRRQCVRLDAMPPGETLGGTGEVARAAGIAGDYRAACLAARALAVAEAGDARRFFETWFFPVDAGTARFDGYYEGEFRGSLTRGGPYQVPVYARPPDLLTARGADGRAVSGRASGGVLVPYASRRDIDAGALRGRGLELLWLADPTDLFFLQLEGAGRVLLPDGRLVRLGYAGQNGREAVPIGRVLAEHGVLAAGDESTAGIRTALAAHPALAAEDPNYVFFRALPDLAPDEGAPGTLGVALAPLRSLAVDRQALPLALPIFYETDETVDGPPLAHLGFAEDTGGDLGSARADIYFGWGEKAARNAGDLHATGRIILLLPRPMVAAPTPRRVMTMDERALSDP